MERLDTMILDSELYPRRRHFEIRPGKGSPGGIIKGEFHEKTQVFLEGLVSQVGRTIHKETVGPVF